jgi:hypothetical protein
VRQEFTLGRFGAIALLCRVGMDEDDALALALHGRCDDLDVTVVVVGVLWRADRDAEKASGGRFGGLVHDVPPAVRCG